MSTNSDLIDWENRGKTIKQLIAELQSFENQGLHVELSIDDGATSKPISLVEKAGNRCLLVYCGDNSKQVTQ